MNTEYIAKEIEGFSSDPSLLALLEECREAAESGEKDVRLKLAEEAARLLYDLRTQEKALKTTIGSVESVLARVMPKVSLDLGDLTVKRNPAQRTEWKISEITPLLVENFAVDPDGCVDPTLLDIARDVTAHLLRFYGVYSCRTTPLREIGLDPDDFSTKGRHSVTVKPAADESAEAGEAA